jgi:hypothetical protein
MKKINGEVLSTHPFSGSEFIQDIIYYDAPILSLYKFEDRLFLWYWMDTSEIMNRWSVIETTMDKLKEWKEKDYVWEFVEDCILNNEVYFINLDTEKKFVVGWKCDVKELVNYD